MTKRPKRQRRGRSTPADERRNAALGEAGRMLKDAARAMKRAKRPEDKLARLAKLLCDRSPKIEREFAAQYAQETAERLAEGAEAAGAALKSLLRAKPGGEEGPLAAAEAADALEQISADLVETACSFRDPKGPQLELPATPAELRACADEAAFGLFAAALELRQAAGLPDSGEAVYRAPRAKGCGCGGAGPGAAEPPAEREPAGIEPVSCGPVPAFDPKAVKPVVEGLLDPLALLAELLDTTALILLFLSGLGEEWYHILCSDDCTGPHSRVITTRITGYRGQTAGGGAFQGYVDFDIDLCCRNRCIGVIREWDVETVQKSIKVGRTLNTRARAIARARRGGARAVLRFLRTGTVPTCPYADPGP